MHIRLTTVAFLASLAARAAAPDYDAAAADARQLIAELVAADTTNPPGNEARAAAIGAARLKALGIAYEVDEFAPGRANLIARLKGEGTEKPLLLLSHTDVVGASGQPWTSDPHKLIEKDGFLVGRASADDLAMSALALQVAKLLKQSGTPLKRDPFLPPPPDDAPASATIHPQLQHNAQP